MNLRSTLTISVTILILAMVVFFLPWLLFTWIAYSIFGPPDEITDIKQYPEIRMQLAKNSDLGYYFPGAIPKTASEVRLSCQPQWLQGGCHLQLWLKLPPNEVKKLAKDFSPYAINRQQASGFNTNNLSQIDTRIPYNHIDPKDGSFPLTFEFYTFPTPPKPGRNSSLPPTQTAGVAISKETNEIVYWLESW